MKQVRNKKKSLNIQNTHWAGLLVLIVVLGSLMSYGLIATLFKLFNRETAVSMLFIIIPMTILMFLSMNWILKKIQRKMNLLTDAIDQVAGGNLSVRIPLEKAEEYRTVYEEFNRMVRELAKTKEEMQTFTNEFAHEFKTPITSINGFAEYLTETGTECETPERLTYLTVIRDQSKRLQNLSVNTLMLSKMEAMQIVTDQETYNLGEQIRHCAILQLPSMEKKKIRIDIPEDFDFPFYGNEEMMAQVWINLISNAVKFTPEGGMISISKTENERELCISVSDTGCGMDQETISHIFEKYYQNDTKSLAKGNGIGLSIVKRVVELHRGRIDVDSIPGEGTTFRVRLPKKSIE